MCDVKTFPLFGEQMTYHVTGKKSHRLPVLQMHACQHSIIYQVSPAFHDL